ncbi:unnamed protein product [Toxocara canis]|uniref:Recombinase domain-containing protein n=1 Tax=Toxocara canis TaxID=6265 RepID=A0A183U8A4_TOXCA|nr:unnamed protein product [Toxocara canis]
MKEYDRRAYVWNMLNAQGSGAFCRKVHSSGCLGSQPKVGGRPHLRLNMVTKPIADKYLEGKLQRTLKREFKWA